MKKKFVVNLIFLVFLNILVKPFWIFGIERSVQNIVGASEFGLYFSLLNFSLILNIILDLGITNYNNRNIAQNHNILSKHLSNIVSLKLLLAIVYAILSIIIALIIDYDLRQIKLLLILVFNQFLLSFILYLRSNISGLQMFKTDSLISVLDRFLMIIIIAVLLWGNITKQTFKIEWFILSQTVSYLFTALIALLVLLKKAKFFKLHFDISFFIVFLRHSFPYALLILLMAFYNRIDSVMIERLLDNGKEQAGIYAQAFRLLDAASMFAYLFSCLLLPMFAKMLKNKENTEELSRLSFLIIIIPTIVLINIIITYKHELMQLMYYHHINESAEILSYLIIGFIGICLTYIFGTLLTANGNLKYLNIVAGTGMLINITLNFIFIPRYQALGAAISSMITQLITGIAQAIIAYKLFNFKPKFKIVIFISAFIIITYILTRYLFLLPYPKLTNCLITTIICALIVLVIGLFNIKIIKAFFNEKHNISIISKNND